MAAGDTNLGFTSRRLERRPPLKADGHLLLERITAEFGRSVLGHAPKFEVTARH
jgi:hypothetical protein